MNAKIDRYIAWRLKPTGFISETEFPQPSFPYNYLITMDGELVRETLHVDAVTDYRPNYVSWLAELSDGSWVLHREDGPAHIEARTEISGSFLDDSHEEVIGAGWATWYLNGNRVDPFTKGMAPLVQLSVIEL